MSQKNPGFRLLSALTVLVLLLVFAFWVCVPLLVIGLFTGFRYSFSGPELGRENVNRAMDKAAEMNMIKVFNMIVLGGLLKIHPIVSIESVLKALRKTLPERHHHLIPMNEDAIRLGMDIIKEMP